MFQKRVGQNTSILLIERSLDNVHDSGTLVNDFAVVLPWPRPVSFFQPRGMKASAILVLQHVSLNLVTPARILIWTIS